MTKKRLKELKKLADSDVDTHFCAVIKELLTEIEDLREELKAWEEDENHIGCVNYPNCDDFGCGEGDVPGHRD